MLIYDGPLPNRVSKFCAYVALFFEVRRFEAGSAGGANWAPGGAEGGIISGQCNWGVWGASPSGVRGRAPRSEK